MQLEGVVGDLDHAGLRWRSRSRRPEWFARSSTDPTRAGPDDETADTCDMTVFVGDCVLVAVVVSKMPDLNGADGPVGPIREELVPFGPGKVTSGGLACESLPGVGVHRPLEPV